MNWRIAIGLYSIILVVGMGMIDPSGLSSGERVAVAGIFYTGATGIWFGFARQGASYVIAAGILGIVNGYFGFRICEKADTWVGIAAILMLMVSGCVAILFDKIVNRREKAN